MKTIFLDKSCIGTVISEYPFVRLLSIPKDAGGHWTALAQVNSMLAIVEVRITPKPEDLTPGYVEG